MKAPLVGPLKITQLFMSMRGGAGEAYTSWHDDVECRCLGHAGLDIAAAEGTPVYAMSAGRISFPKDSYSPFLGTYAVITLPSGETHYYAHLSSHDFGENIWIPQGVELGLSGHTGNVFPAGPLGAHLHIAMRPPHPNYHNGADGFENLMTHFDLSVQQHLDLSLV